MEEELLEDSAGKWKFWSICDLPQYLIAVQLMQAHMPLTILSAKLDFSRNF